MLDLRSDPYLVQRLKLNEYSQGKGKGVDAHFTMDYMGSAEFEFGALPASLKIIREYIKDDWEPMKIKVGEHVAWFVGLKELYNPAKLFFAEQLGVVPEGQVKRHRLKELTNLMKSYESNKYYEDIVGWWAIDAYPCPWAIFKKKDYAKLWLKGLGNK